MQQLRIRVTGETLRKTVAVFVVVWLSFLTPAVAFAQDAVDATGTPTGAPEDTGAQVCTGAGCGQGENQGEGQGADQGGPSLEDLGATTDESGNTVLPAGVEDTRQGAAQGTSNGITAENTGTGADSTNSTDVDATSSTTNSVNNTAVDTTDAAAAAGTGNNTQSKNTGTGGISTGNAGIGVTQVKNDNTATINGSAGLTVMGHEGDYLGDLLLAFGAGTASLSGAGGPSSVRAINDTTGSDSTNAIGISTTTERIDEVQNDGTINNLLDLAAVTGRNEANMNTGDGSITTGDADVAATLVNLLNTTVIDGNLWVSVADIFGNLNGNIILPDFAALAALVPSAGLMVDAINEQTGADSTNTVDVDVTDNHLTDIANDATITTTVDAKAITGQNEAMANTGGGFVETGDAQVSASNISLANTTIQGGNWGLVIVNALNRWLGFLVGDNGEVRALSQEETLREIEARNSATGSDSDNTIDVDVENNHEQHVTNNAEIVNDVTAAAITGENTANKNTGQGQIDTGNAAVEVTAVNIANTTVVGGSLFIAVVNVFGDWFGDLLYDGGSLLAAAAAGAAAGGPTVEVNAENAETGAGSDNSVDVTVNRHDETQVENDADVRTTLNAEVDTGSNKANRNTLGGEIDTGDGLLALHARSLANLTGIAIGSPMSLSVTGLNDTTGFDSRNTIRAELNDERIVEVDNEANVSTIFAGGANSGNNEANQNTIGGSISTGDVSANASIHNLVNRVLLALAGGGFAAGDGIDIDADLMNLLTGALSENENEVEANYDFLADIMNSGFVTNLVDLLLNTGGNTANENTDGASIVTGGGCVDVTIHNSVNTNSLAGLGGWTFNLGSIFANDTTGWNSDNSNALTVDNNSDANVDNEAEVDNTADVAVTTGNNELSRNTNGGQQESEEGACDEKLAQAPEQPPVPSQPGEEEHEAAGGGVGGGDVGPDEPEGRVSGAIDEQEKPRVPRLGNGGGILKRFPVAGAASDALWSQGVRRSPWVAFALVSTLLVLAAYHLDRQTRQPALKKSKV